eukprot:6182438-Pleurochrysis_carterae.AAC.1
MTIAIAATTTASPRAHRSAALRTRAFRSSDLTGPISSIVSGASGRPGRSSAGFVSWCRPC